MSYRDWFNRGAYYKSDVTVQCSAYLVDPHKCRDQENIIWMDKQADRMISECSAVIEKLKDYRKALAARYAELETMTYQDRLLIERHPAWNGRGVTFDIRIIRRYSDGTEIDQLREHYTGKQRRDALNRFESLKKQRPGIPAETDIEKRSWER